MRCSSDNAVIILGTDSTSSIVYVAGFLWPQTDKSWYKENNLESGSKPQYKNNNPISDIQVVVQVK